jgi:hypothetical protein
MARRGGARRWRCICLVTPAYILGILQNQNSLDRNKIYKFEGHSKINSSCYSRKFQVQKSEGIVSVTQHVLNTHEELQSSASSARSALLVVLGNISWATWRFRRFKRFRCHCERWSARCEILRLLCGFVY